MAPGLWVSASSALAAAGRLAESHHCLQRAYRIGADRGAGAGAAAAPLLAACAAAGSTTPTVTAAVVKLLQQHRVTPCAEGHAHLLRLRIAHGDAAGAAAAADALRRDGPVLPPPAAAAAALAAPPGTHGDALCRALWRQQLTAPPAPPPGGGRRRAALTPAGGAARAPPPVAAAALRRLRGVAAAAAAGGGDDVMALLRAPLALCERRGFVLQPLLPRAFQVGLMAALLSVATGASANHEDWKKATGVFGYMPRAFGWAQSIGILCVYVQVGYHWVSGEYPAGPRDGFEMALFVVFAQTAVESPVQLLCALRDVPRSF